MIRPFAPENDAAARNQVSRVIGLSAPENDVVARMLCHAEPRERHFQAYRFLGGRIILGKSVFGRPHHFRSAVAVSFWAPFSEKEREESEKNCTITYIETCGFTQMHTKTRMHSFTRKVENILFYTKKAWNIFFAKYFVLNKSNEHTGGRPSFVDTY